MESVIFPVLDCKKITLNAPSYLSVTDCYLLKFVGSLTRKNSLYHPLCSVRSVCYSMVFLYQEISSGHSIVSFFHVAFLYRPIISRTTRSDIFTAPTKTSILKINSPIYAQTIVTAAAPCSTSGGDDAKSTKIIHASTIMAPSRQTAA